MDTGGDHAVRHALRFRCRHGNDADLNVPVGDGGFHIRNSQNFHAVDDLAECKDVASARIADLVTRAVAVKARVVAADFTESTSKGSAVGREALNYGHTLGHAIERHAGYTWRHGQAISVGMAWIARVSRDLLGLDRSFVALHDELLGGLGLPLAYDAPFADLRPIMSLDKKARGTTLRLVGLTGQGAPRIVDDAPEDVLASAYAELTR